MTHLRPSYEAYPSNCQLGDVTVQVELDPVSLPFPTFISEIPTTWIEFGTTDLTAVGVYNFKLIAIDSLTGQQNSEVGFEVTIIAIDNLALIDSTAIADQVYKVNDPAIALPVPQYNPEPLIADRFFEYTIVSPTPSFITLDGTNEFS